MLERKSTYRRRQARHSVSRRDLWRTALDGAQSLISQQGYGIKYTYKVLQSRGLQRIANSKISREGAVEPPQRYRLYVQELCMTTYTAQQTAPSAYPQRIAVLNRDIHYLEIIVFFVFAESAHPCFLSNIFFMESNKWHLDAAEQNVLLSYLVFMRSVRFRVWKLQFSLVSLNKYSVSSCCVGIECWSPQLHSIIPNCQINIVTRWTLKSSVLHPMVWDQDQVGILHYKYTVTEY